MKDARKVMVVVLLAVAVVVGLSAVHGAGAASSDTVTFGSGKLCSALKPASWRDTIPMPNAATESGCQEWADLVGATTFQLGCVSSSGTVSLGTSGGGAPSPNCGW